MSSESTRIQRRDGLTDRKVRNAKPRREPYKLPDGRGLHLYVSPAGGRLWRYRYRIADKENIYAIGAYPDVSLSEAREARDEARKLVRKGIHPAHERKIERLRKAFETANTFRAVAQEWIEANRPDWTARTTRQRE